MRIKDICEIHSNFPDADFWLVRRGTKEAIGRPTNKFHKESIGIKITATDAVLPDYLFRWFQFIHSRKFFEQHATGALNLVHITSKFVSELPVKFL